MAEKNIDSEIESNSNKNTTENTLTVDDAGTDAKQFSHDKVEEKPTDVLSSKQRASGFRQTPKYNDHQSFVTQSHHSIGTGLFLTDEVHDLPPRFRDKVVKVLETCAALNNIPLKGDPLTYLGSVSFEPEGKKNNSNPLFISSSSSSHKDEKNFETKRAPQRAPSNECDTNNVKEEVPNFNQSHSDSSNNHHKNSNYKSDSYSRTSKDMNKTYVSNIQNVATNRGNSQSQSVSSQLQSLHSHTHLEASHSNKSYHPKYQPIRTSHNKDFQTQRTRSKPFQATNSPKQYQMEYQNKNPVKANDSLSVSNLNVDKYCPDNSNYLEYIKEYKIKGSLTPSEDVIISYDNREDKLRDNSKSKIDSSFHNKSFKKDYLQKPVISSSKHNSDIKHADSAKNSEKNFHNYKSENNSANSKILKSNTDVNKADVLYSKNNNSMHRMKDDSCVSSKSFLHGNATCSYPDESNFSLDSKSFNRNKTSRKFSDLEKKTGSEINTFHSKKAYARPNVNNYNSSEFTENHRSRTFSESESIPDCASPTVLNKFIKSNKYSHREFNNNLNKSHSSRNYKGRNSNENLCSGINSKVINFKNDNSKTTLYSETYLNRKFLDERSGRNAKSSTLKSYEDDTCNIGAFNHHKNSSSKLTDIVKESENFTHADIDLHSKGRGGKAFKDLNRQENNTEEYNHKYDNNRCSDASSIKSSESWKAPNSSRCNNLKKNKQFSTLESEYPDSDNLSISNTSVDTWDSDRNSYYSKDSNSHEKQTKAASPKYSKGPKGSYKKYSGFERSNSNLRNCKQTNRYSNESLDHMTVSKSQREFGDKNEKYNGNRQKYSIERDRSVKTIKENKKNRKVDVGNIPTSFVHSERTRCYERGFFLKIKVSEESSNLEYWLNSFKSIFPFQFTIERCCHFSDILILTFEQKMDAVAGIRILIKEKKKKSNLDKPHVINFSTLKYHLIKPCDCEQKIIPDSIASIEKNAQLSLSVIHNKMEEIQVSEHRRKSREVANTEREMLKTFENSESNFINFKKEIISKIKATENLNAIEKLKLCFLRECNIFKRCLPIYSSKDTILHSVKFYPVTIILAETGSGKSTQLVEYLLHSHFADHGVIICTQPRKLAAITVAQYVSGQIGSAIGKVVGYDVGLERKRSDMTKVIYMTDYCLLKTYLRNRNLKDVACIIIDEAHERSLYTDLLLGMLKKCLPQRPDLRVIITSATINPTIFADYFNVKAESVIEVPGRSYPVDVIWWPRNVELGWDYVEACVQQVYTIHTREKDGDILVFLTSPGESEEAIHLFKRYLTKKDKKVKLFCLHGKSDFREQIEIFQTSPYAARKIIFATNVAETAVTIPGIKYVVDSGMTKGLVFDPKKNKSVLSVTFINKSSAEQRKGRAGRTQSGVCYRMYSKKNFTEDMADNAVPEILKTNLQKALLKIFEFEIDVKDFNFIESPPDKTISNAISSLEYLGAIENKNLTVLGRKLTKLPLEPQWGKLVLSGVEAGIGFETVIIAALVSESSKLFIRNVDNKTQADQKKKMFCHEGGDLCTYLEVYKRWKEIVMSHRFGWCVENYVSLKALNAASKSVFEIISSLKADLCISISKRYNNSAFKQHFERILFDSFSENLCVSSGHPKLGYLSPFLPESFNIHPSSTLCYLGKEIPEYLIYSTLMETTRNFLFDITPISEETIKLANQAGTFKIPLNSLKCLEIPPKVMGPFGESVLIRYVLGKEGCKIKDLELKFKDITNTKNIQIDVSVDKGLITAYIGHRYHEKIATVISEIINKAHHEMLKEEDVIKLAKTSVHYALGAGGIINDIIMPGEYRELVISKLDKIKCSSVRDLLENFGSVQSVDETTCNYKQVQICVTYKKVCDAMKAFSDLSEMKMRVVPKPYLPNVSDKTLPLYMLKISWCRRPCIGKGWVEFNSEEDLIVASGILTHSSFHVDNKYVIFTPYDRCSRKLLMTNLPTTADENVLFNNLCKRLPDHIHIKGINIERMLIKTVDSDIEDGRKKLTQLLNSFISSNKVVVDVKNPMSRDNFWEASVYFECFDDGENAFKKFQDNVTINSYPLSVSKVLKSSFDCKKEIYDAISHQIITFLKKQKVQFNIKDNIKVSKDKVTVEFTCVAIEDLTKTRQVLIHLLQGETINFIGKPKCHFLFCHGYSKRIKQIEKKTNTVIYLNDLRKVITIYGLTENCKKAMEEIYSVTSDSNLSNIRVFNLNDSCIPHSFLKNVYTKYGYNLHGLIDAFELTAAEIETDKGILILRGSKYGIQQVTCFSQCMIYIYIYI